MWVERDVKLSVNTEGLAFSVGTVPVNSVCVYVFEK